MTICSTTRTEWSRPESLNKSTCHIVSFYHCCCCSFLVPGLSTGRCILRDVLSFLGSSLNPLRDLDSRSIDSSDLGTINFTLLVGLLLLQIFFYIHPSYFEWKVCTIFNATAPVPSRRRRRRRRQGCVSVSDIWVDEEIYAISMAICSSKLCVRAKIVRLRSSVAGIFFLSFWILVVSAGELPFRPTT